MHAFFDLVIPLLGIHSWDINFEHFAKKYRQGSALQHLLTSKEENKHRFLDGRLRGKPESSPEWN